MQALVIFDSKDWDESFDEFLQNAPKEIFYNFIDISNKPQQKEAKKWMRFYAVTKTPFILLTDRLKKYGFYSEKGESAFTQFTNFINKKT